MTNDTLQDDRRMPFYVIDNRIIDEMGSSLGPHAIAAYNVIVRHANGDTGKDSFPSYKTIGKKSGMARSTAVVAVEKLIEFGLVKKESRYNSKGQASNHYTVIDFGRVSPGDGLTKLQEGESGRRTHLVRETDSPSPGDGHDQDTSKKNKKKDCVDSAAPSSTPTVKAKRDKKQTRAVDPNVAPPLTVPATPPQPTDQQQWFGNICELTGLDSRILTKAKTAEIGKMITKLRAAGYTLAQLQRIDREVWAKDWRNKDGQRPTVQQIPELMAKFKTETPSYTNGHSKAPARPSMEQWLFDTYGMDNLTIIAMSTGKSKDDIEMEYQLA